jgi:hypothetical protein
LEGLDIEQLQGTGKNELGVRGPQQRFAGALEARRNDHGSRLATLNLVQQRLLGGQAQITLSGPVKRLHIEDCRVRFADNFPADQVG